MRRHLAFLLIFLPWTAQASELVLDCQGQTRFIHRGAPSTYPAEEQRRYHMHNNRIDTMPCTATEAGITCFGLTPQQAMRRVQIDRAAKTVRDALELPTSELIFEGRCQ